MQIIEFERSANNAEVKVSRRNQVRSTILVRLIGPERRDFSFEESRHPATLLRLHDDERRLPSTVNQQ